MLPFTASCASEKKIQNLLLRCCKCLVCSYILCCVSHLDMMFYSHNSGNKICLIFCPVRVRLVSYICKRLRLTQPASVRVRGASYSDLHSECKSEGSKQSDNLCCSFLKLESKSDCLLYKLEQNSLAQASFGSVPSLGKEKHSGLLLMPTLCKEEWWGADNKTWCCVLEFRAHWVFQ